MYKIVKLILICIAATAPFENYRLPTSPGPSFQPPIEYLVQPAPPVNPFNGWLPTFSGVPAVLPSFFPYAIARTNLGDYGSIPSNGHVAYGGYAFSSQFTALPPELLQGLHADPHEGKLAQPQAKYGGANSAEGLYEPGRKFPATLARTYGTHTLRKRSMNI